LKQGIKACPCFIIGALTEGIAYNVQQQERAFLLSVILHGDVNACPPRLEQFAPYHSLQVRGADTLMRGPYLGSCCRPSSQRMNKLTPISM